MKGYILGCYICCSCTVIDLVTLASLLTVLRYVSPSHTHTHTPGTISKRAWSRRKSDHRRSLHNIFNEIDTWQSGHIDIRSFLDAIRNHDNLKRYFHIKDPDDPKKLTKEGKAIWRKIDLNGRWEETRVVLLLHVCVIVTVIVCRKVSDWFCSSPSLSRASLLSSLIITLIPPISLSPPPSQQVDFDEFSDYFLHDARLDEARQREQMEAEEEWKSLEAVRLKKEAAYEEAQRQRQLVIQSKYVGREE